MELLEELELELLLNTEDELLLELDDDLLLELLLELLLDDDAHALSTATQRLAEHWHARDVNGADATPVELLTAQLPAFPILAP